MRRTTTSGGEGRERVRGGGRGRGGLRQDATPHPLGAEGSRVRMCILVQLL